MSKRNSLSRKTSVLICLAALFVVLVFFASSLVASAPVVKIQYDRDIPLGMYAFVDVTIDSTAGQPGFGGFDLLIAYDQNALTFVSATSGMLLSTCHWEYFSYNSMSIPDGRWAVRLMATADINNGDIHPICYLGGQSGVISDLKFLVTNDRTYECQFLPIEFYWANCGNNAFASLNNDTLFVAGNVYSYFDHQYPWDPFPVPDTVNTSTGLPNSCLSGPIGARTPSRLIDYMNGGLDTACPDSIDRRGDINLNGIANEVADFVMFENYFLYGYSAFPNSTPGSYLASIAASDVNSDGQPLEFRDFVYLWRVVIGDALPFPKRPAVDTSSAEFIQDISTRVISVNYSQNLAGARFVFRGSITPSTLLPSTDIVFNHFAGLTKVVMPPATSTSHGNGAWMSYTGSGVLIEVETADWSDNVIVPSISLRGLNGPCGDIDASGDATISDAVYLISFIFGGGPMPLDVKSGDVNCDNACDISDVVYLIAYIFGGGPTPCQSCK